MFGGAAPGCGLYEGLDLTLHWGHVQRGACAQSLARAAGPSPARKQHFQETFLNLELSYQSIEFVRKLMEFLGCRLNCLGSLCGLRACLRDSLTHET